MKKEDVFNKTSKEILAPALNDFVLWILDKAQHNGIRRLYFLARDGYLMYRCVRIYVERFHLPIECRYLCCSRYSLRLPMYHRDMGAALDYICRGGTEVTLDRILDRSGIKEEEKRITLEQLGMTGQRKKPISYPHLKRIRQKLEECPFFLKVVETNSREKLPSLLGYLEQEGLTEEGPIALVDSGWTGSMQKEICQALGILGKKERLTGYYWGLYELPKGVRREDYHCYYFSPEAGLRKKVYFSNSLFESIFSAPQGMTTGYDKVQGQWRPVYARTDEERKRFLEELEKILLEYARNQAASMKHIEDSHLIRDRQETEKSLSRFMGKPEFQEAQIFGNQPFSDDIFDTGDQTETAAGRMTEEELKANHVWNKVGKMSGFSSGYVKESPWYEGSAVLYGKRPGYHIFMYHLYKYLLYLKKETDFKYREKKKLFHPKRNL